MKKLILMIVLLSIIVLSGCEKIDCVSEVDCSNSSELLPSLIKTDNPEDKCIFMTRERVTQYINDECEVKVIVSDVEFERGFDPYIVR